MKGVPFPLEAKHFLSPLTHHHSSFELTSWLGLSHSLKYRIFMILSCVSEMACMRLADSENWSQFDGFLTDG